MELMKKLTKFYLRMAEIDVPVDYFKNSKELNDELYAIVRKKIQQGYLIGHGIVEKAIIRRVPNYQVFISGTDIDRIAALTKFTMEQLWITFGKLLQRRNEFRLRNQVFEQKKPFDTEAAITGLAELAVFSGYNDAIGSKINNIKSLQPRGRASALGDVFKKIGSSIKDAFSDLFAIGEVQELEMREMFLTKEDDKVDPKICEPYNRSIFNVNDPNKPTPPLHRFCRCTMVPVIE